MSLTSLTRVTVHPVLCRAEKDRSQFASENNDMRAALDHVSNDKVTLPTPPPSRFVRFRVSLMSSSSCAALHDARHYHTIIIIIIIIIINNNHHNTNKHNNNTIDHAPTLPRPLIESIINTHQASRLPLILTIETMKTKLNKGRRRIAPA